jgi:hypothetical protein
MEPRFIQARFGGRCPETGREFRKGDTVAWFPRERKAFHESSKAAEQVRGLQFSKSWGMADADW